MEHNHRPTSFVQRSLLISSEQVVVSKDISDKMSFLEQLYHIFVLG